jgi:hypothetical protein
MANGLSTESSTGKSLTSVPLLLLAFFCTFFCTSAWRDAAFEYPLVI